MRAGDRRSEASSTRPGRSTPVSRWSNGRGGDRQVTCSQPAGAKRMAPFRSIPRLARTRIRPVADPVIQGRSVVVEAIRSLAIACRAWAAYPSDHPNATQAVSAAQARVDEMLSAHGSVAISVTRDQLRVGVWSLETPQARALAQALYRRQAAVVRLERGVPPEELRSLVQWLAGPVLPLEPGTPAAGPPGFPGARHVYLQPVDYSAVRLTDRAGPTAT